MNNETRQLLEQCLKALNESREDVAQAVSELPMHKADIERRRSLVLTQLENHEKCIEDIKAALAKPVPIKDFDDAAFNAFTAAGQKAWKDVPNASEWVDKLRGKPVQEPIWYTNTLDAENDTPKVMSYADKHGEALAAEHCAIPLYTSPQFLTPIKEIELTDIYSDVLGINALDDTECKIVLKIARLIEAHHGIGVK